jgi:putative cardiolipin synthase
LIITNSLASNNHTAVHSGYAGYRKRLLDIGVELYEARANAVDVASDGDSDAEVLTLHTKAMLIDRKRLFVGSLNLDPRSKEINSEMGLLVDSPDMGKQLSDRLLARLPRLAYRVERDNKGRLEWHGNIDGAEVVERSEPLASGWLRFKAFLLKIVPNSQL